MVSYKDFVANLVSNYYEVADGQLIIGGMPIVDIVNRFDTPLFLYYPDIFKKKLALLRNALPGVDVFFSVKANPIPAIIKILIYENCGLEIASGGKLVLAHKLWVRRF